MNTSEILTRWLSSLGPSPTKKALESLLQTADKLALVGRMVSLTERKFIFPDGSDFYISIPENIRTKY